MFNIALPMLAREFSLTPTRVSWAAISFGIVFAIGSVTYGKLADIFPVKRLIVIGLIVFSIGSLIGYFSLNYAMLIFGRVVQGAGAASIPALSMVVATRYFPQGMRGRIMGYTSSTVALGMGVGPLLGGVIISLWGWEALFLFSLGSLLGLPFLLKYLPIDPGKGASFDLPGAILFGCGAAFLLMGVNLNTYMFIASLICFALFFMHIRHVKEPFVRFDLLMYRRYRLLLFLGFCIFCTTGSFFFMMPLMLEGVHQLGAAQMGFVLFPGTMTAALLGSSAGKLSDRFGSKRVILGSTLMMMTSYFLLSSWLGAYHWIIAVFMIGVYLGFSSLSAALGSMVASSLRADEVGIGTGLYNLLNFMGGAIGTAMNSRFLEFNTTNWNPFYQDSAFSEFSNAFLIMVGFCIVSLIMLYLVDKEKSINEPLREKVQQT